MDDVVIVAAQRTAVGKFGGTLSKIPATELGAQVIKQLMAKTGIDPASVSEVILGQVLTAGVGQNPARQAVIKAGLPDSIPASTLNVVCGSGLRATHLAAQAIKCGDAQIVIAGGQENMSASPHVLNGSRDGFRMGDAKLTDTMIVDGLWDVYNQYHMGVTAENVAKQVRHLARRAGRVRAAVPAQGRSRHEGRQVQGRDPADRDPSKKGATVFDTDEYPKHGATLEGLASLRPAFNKEGSVTAGNASGLNDGAAAVIMMSASKAAELGLTPLAASRPTRRPAWIRPSWAWARCRPPQLCLEKAGWTPKTST
jgi:acetyl-CoA C-acetyltransferase